MPTTPDSDVYPTDTYMDPLLMPLYIKTNDASSIEVQAKEGFLLKTYIGGLNQEIVDAIPELKDQKELVQQILHNLRSHGWCVVVPYENIGPKVFSSLEWAEWITEEVNLDEVKKVVRIGCKVRWTDDLQNVWQDEIIFKKIEKPAVTNPDEGDQSNDSEDSPQESTQGDGYLFVWEQGNGRILPNSPNLSAFAIADLTTSILGLAIQCRQILNTLTHSATHPYFYHLVYGDSITPAQRTQLIRQMSYVGASKAIGAKMSMLQEIRAIENSATDNSLTALIQEIGLFSGETRLPLSFYLGEKQTGGLGDTGESEDEVKISKKKDSILNRISFTLTNMMSEVFGITVPDLTDYFKHQAEEKQQLAMEQQQAKLESKGFGNKNEKGTQGTNKE